MRTKSSLVAVVLLLSILSAFADFEIGENLGQIKTADGVVYQNAVLSKVEPVGISITHQSGLARIAFAKLPPELQKKFNYQPEAASVFELEQKYQRQIAVLENRIAELEKQLAAAGKMPAQASAAASQPAQSAKPSLAKGFTLFANEMRNKSGGMTGKATAGGGGRLVYRTGPLAGKSRGEGEVVIQSAWEKLSGDEQLAYAEKSTVYGTGENPVDESNRLNPKPSSGGVIYPAGGGSYIISK